jgi:hypothetical protein
VRQADTYDFQGSLRGSSLHPHGRYDRRLLRNVEHLASAQRRRYSSTSQERRVEAFSRDRSLQGGSSVKCTPFRKRGRGNGKVEVKPRGGGCICRAQDIRDRVPRPGDLMLVSRERQLYLCVHEEQGYVSCKRKSAIFVEISLLLKNVRPGISTV